MSRQRRLVLDAGALIDIETDPPRRDLPQLREGFENGYRPYPPTVVLAAVEHNAAVLTSDPKDLTKLASAAEYAVRPLTV